MTVFAAYLRKPNTPPPAAWETVGTYAGVDYDGLYIVSDAGQVFDVTADTPVIPSTDTKGVTVVTLTAHGRAVTYALDRLVLICFEGPAPYRQALVIHVNKKADDCRLKNLKWFIPGTGTPNTLTADARRLFSGDRRERDDMMTVYVSALMRRRGTGQRVSVGAGR